MLNQFRENLPFPFIVLVFTLLCSQGCRGTEITQGFGEQLSITESNSPTRRALGNSKKAPPRAVLLGEGNFQVYFCFLLLLHLGLARTVLSVAEKEPSVVNEVATNSCFFSEHSITVRKVITNPAAPRVLFPGKLLNSFRIAKQHFFSLPVINILGTARSSLPRKINATDWKAKAMGSMEGPHGAPLLPAKGHYVHVKG